MKLTRFAQSCVLIETKRKRILVDPGIYQYEDSLIESDWNNIDVVLITHKHGDHCHVPAIQEILKNGKTKIYTSSEVAADYSEISFQTVKVGEIIEVEGIKIEAVKAVHGFLPFLKGGKEVNEGLGFIVDDGDRRVYFVGDSISFDNDYKCDVLFVPICNHGLVMGPFEAAWFAKERGAGLVIPYHYESPKFPGDLEWTKREFDKQGLNYKILELKESVEV